MFSTRSIICRKKKAMFQLIKTFTSTYHSTNIAMYVPKAKGRKYFEQITVELRSSRTCGWRCWPVSYGTQQLVDVVCPEVELPKY